MGRTGKGDERDTRSETSAPEKESIISPLNPQARTTAGPPPQDPLAPKPLHFRK